MAVALVTKTLPALIHDPLLSGHQNGVLPMVAHSDVASQTMTGLLIEELSTPGPHP